MLPFAILAIFAVICSNVALATFERLNQYLLIRQAVERVNVQRLAERLQEYAETTGELPTSIQSLSATQGFEGTSALQSGWVFYQISDVLTDAKWEYKRAVLFAIDPSKFASPIAYTAKNACGTGSASIAATWCGESNGSWWRIETKEVSGSALASQRARLNRIVQKIANFYNVAATLPSTYGSNVSLVPNTTYPLPTLAGFAGSANGCTGQFHWRGIPLDCADMFDRWGKPVGLTFFSTDHVTLSSETPLRNASGLPITVSSDFNSL